MIWSSVCSAVCGNAKSAADGASTWNFDRRKKVKGHRLSFDTLVRFFAVLPLLILYNEIL